MIPNPSKYLFIWENFRLPFIQCFIQPTVFNAVFVFIHLEKWKMRFSFFLHQWLPRDKYKENNQLHILSFIDSDVNTYYSYINIQKYETRFEYVNINVTILSIFVYVKNAISDCWQQLLTKIRKLRLIFVKFSACCASEIPN